MQPGSTGSPSLSCTVFRRTLGRVLVRRSLMHRKCSTDADSCCLHLSLPCPSSSSPSPGPVTFLDQEPELALPSEPGRLKELIFPCSLLDVPPSSVPLITYLKAIDSLAAARRPRGIACLAKSRSALASRLRPQPNITRQGVICARDAREIFMY